MRAAENDLEVEDVVLDLEREAEVLSVLEGRARRRAPL
jgi:hypothetical protein